MKKLLLILGIVMTLAAMTGPTPPAATAAADCSRYFGRGYCTDWVAQRTGRRQRGDAGSWQANRGVDQGEPGDVIIQRIGSYGHVAVIERVQYRPYTAIPAAYDVSEMNFGPRMVNAPCAVTNYFGRVTYRTVKVSAVAGVWRP